MHSPQTLKTEFAPAERADPATIQAQAHFFTSMPSVERGLLDAVPNVMLVLNAQRQVVYANDALLKLLGLPDINPVLGQRPGDVLNCVHGLESECGCGTTVFCRTCGVVQAILASLAGQQAQRECRITQRDGAALDLRVQATPLQINDETYSVFTVQDIRDEKRRQALERIFFHDLLNIAQVLVGYASLLTGMDIPGTSRRYVDVIENAADNLVREINAQRDLTLAESGDLPVMTRPVESLAFMHTIQDFYAHHEVAGGRALALADGSDPVTFRSDPVLLGRVVGNMVKNALEACDPGDTVTMRCRAEHEWVVFEVHNPQVMPDDVQLRVFQRSFSTKGSGRGLGTYSIKLLSERYLNGIARFTSAPDTGTIFSVACPLDTA